MAGDGAVAMTDESTVQAAIVARLLLLGDPWKESRFLPDQLGRDSASVAHGAFSVDFPSSDFVGDRGATVLQRKARIIVRFLWHVKPMDHLESYLAALASEDILIRQLIPDVWTGDLRLTYASSLRSTLDGGLYRLHELTFNGLYYFDVG